MTNRKREAVHRVPKLDRSLDGLIAVHLLCWRGGAAGYCHLNIVACQVVIPVAIDRTAAAMISVLTFIFSPLAKLALPCAFAVKIVIAGCWDSVARSMVLTPFGRGHQPHLIFLSFQGFALPLKSVAPLTDGRSHLK